MRRLFDLERARALMVKHNIQALVASSMDNFGYLTGYWPPSGKYKDIGWIGNPILSLVAIPLEKSVDPFFLTAWYKDDVDYVNPWINDRRYYGSPAEGILDEGGIYREFSKIIAEKGLQNSRIGLELGYNAYTIEIASSMMVEKLRNFLPDAEFEDGSRLLREMRLIKTGEEINRIKEASGISERAIKASFEEVTAGMTELELERVVRRNLAEYDVEAALIGINFGEDDILRPTEKKLVKGDYVRLDLAVKQEAYFGDVTRTVVFGEPSAALQRVYNALSKIHDATIDKLKPGAKCSSIYNATKDLLRKSGIKYEPPLVAHGTGICVHEGPYINDNDVTIQPGMAMAVEIVEKLGRGSYVTIEDMAICEEHGCTDITTLPKELAKI